MLLEEKIHEFWQNTPLLCTVIPSDRFFTGPSPIPAIPCIILMHEKSDILFHTNRSTPWRKSVLRFELYHHSLDTGLGITQVIEQKFDRLQLQDPEGNESFRFHFLQSENLRMDDGTWKFVRRFIVNN